MTIKSVRRPNNFVLIATGIALLLVALRAEIAATNGYPIPVKRVGGKAVAVALSCTRDAVLGTALLIVALRSSRFAGPMAVIVATVLMLALVLRAAFDLAVYSSVRTSSFAAIYLAIAAALVSSVLFPWNRTAFKPVLFWMSVTVGAAVILGGSLAILARL